MATWQIRLTLMRAKLLRDVRGGVFLYAQPAKEVNNARLPPSIGLGTEIRAWKRN